MRQYHLGSFHNILISDPVPALECRIGAGGPLDHDICPVSINIEFYTYLGYGLEIVPGRDHPWKHLLCLYYPGI